jgi:hypothetical protein
MGQQNLQIILDGQYTGGCDSLLYPTDLVPGTYAWGVNVTNRGGIVQTRPGKKRVASFCGRKGQGLYWVRTIDDRNYLLVAIDGKVYWAPFPFTKGGWTQMEGVSFDPETDWIYFANTVQAVKYDDSGAIVLIEPRNVVFMQDGKSQPCYWQADDFSSGIADVNYVEGNPAVGTGAKQGVPIGTAMLWQDNRLWVASGALVRASDFLYGASFYEDSLLAEKSGFRFPRKVVNMFPAPVQGIVVYTDGSMHALQSFIQDRDKWQETEGFQSDVNLEIGLVGPFAYGLLHGMPWFLTARGLISYDRALTQNLSTVILTTDGEMARSKHLFAPDVTHSVIGVWENVLMVAVPASSFQNRHTWIMDAGIAEKLNNTGGMCWTGIWVGTFPIQFSSPIVEGTQHNYELAYSSGYLALGATDSPSPQPETDLPPQSYIHLYENFIPNQIDGTETNIHCSFETKAFILATDDYYRFVFAEFMLTNLKGVVPIKVYFTGLGGNYQLLFKTTLRADVGPWGNPTPDTVLYYHSQSGTTEFENYRRQVRHMRASDWVVKESNDKSACIEINRFDGVDKAFQLMVQWQGRLGIRQIKFFYDRQLQAPQGQCPVDESITPHIVLEATA